MQSVLIVSMDTMRHDYVTPEIMPYLSSLKSESLYLDQVVVGGSWTVPSHTCLFTGQGPWHHKFLGQPPNKLRAEFSHKTILGRLQGRGYDTHWWGASVLNSCRRQDETWGGPGEEGVSADDQVDEILEWISNRKRPWGMVLHYWGAHAPYGLDKTCIEVGVSLRDPSNVESTIRAYKDRLSEIDHQIEEIINHLNDNVLILITSDHGEDFGVGHKMQRTFNYLHMHCTAWRDRVIVVPAFILNGGIDQTINYQVRNYDLAPTLWSLLFGEDFEGATGYPVWIEGQGRIAESWSTEWGVDIATVRLGGKRATRLLTNNEAWLMSGDIPTWEELYGRAERSRDRVVKGSPGERWGAVESRLRELGYF